MQATALADSRWGYQHNLGRLQAIHYLHNSPGSQSIREYVTQ